MQTYSWPPAPADDFLAETETSCSLIQLVLTAHVPGSMSYREGQAQSLHITFPPATWFDPLSEALLASPA